VPHGTTPALRKSGDVCHGLASFVTGRVTGGTSEKGRIYWVVTLSRVEMGGAPEGPISNDQAPEKPQAQAPKGSGRGRSQGMEQSKTKWNKV